jgi:hypothetical protein
MPYEVNNACNPIVSEAIELYDTEGRRLYLTSAQRDAFLDAATQANRPVRMLYAVLCWRKHQSEDPVGGCFAFGLRTSRDPPQSSNDGVSASCDVL